MRRELIGLAVVLLGFGCGTETKYIAHATPQAKACGEYAQLLQSIDRYCGLDCDDTCRHGYFDQCFEGTEPAQVEQIDRCAELAPSFNCDEYQSIVWSPICELP